MTGGLLGWFVAAAFAAIGIYMALSARRQHADQALRAVRAEAALAALRSETAVEREHLAERLNAADAAVAALEERRARLADTLARLTIPIWQRGPDLALADCNPAFAAAVDCVKDVAIAEGRMLGGPTVSARARELARLARAGSTAQSEAMHVVVHGQRRLLEITEAPLPDGGTVGLAVDVTEREEAQDELRRSMGAQGEVLENLATAIAIYGADQRLKFFNTAFARLWRIDEAWLRTEPDHGAVLEELRARRRLPEYADFRDFKRQRLKLFASLIEPVEELTYIPDGTTLRTRIAPHPMGGLMFTYEDVTDILVLERSYNTLIAVQRETLDNLHEGIAVIGPDGRLKLSNPAYARLWQLPGDALAAEPHIAEIVERTKAFYQFDGAWAAEKERLVASLTERTQRRERLERIDGSVLDLSAVPLPDGGVLLSWVDVTDSTRVEHALRERAAALETADRLKSEFISSVSYELRTPLNTIIGFTEILAHQYYGTLNPRQAEMMSRQYSASERLLTIINDILDLASIEAGRLTLDREAVEPRALIESCVQLMADWARSQDLVLRAEIEPGLPPLDADDRRLKQAMCNLISNAIRFTPNGGVVEVGARRHEGGQIALSVSDTGIGIAAEHHERVFREFERIRHRDQRNTGAGLGLSLVRRIVELHGGTVALDSAPGRGTTVTVTIPALAVQTRAPAA